VPHQGNRKKWLKGRHRRQKREVLHLNHSQNHCRERGGHGAMPSQLVIWKMVSEEKCSKFANAKEGSDG